MPGTSERWVQIDIDSQRLTLFKGRQRISGLARFDRAQGYRRAC